MKSTKITFFSHAFISILTLVIILSPNLIKATITPVGDIDPAYPGGNPDPWNVGDDLTIGNTGVGSVDVNDESGITNVYGYIGRGLGSGGTVTITDPLSYWTNSSYLYVGLSGDANMVISNGGTVTNTGGVIATNETSVGYATVTGPNSLWTNSSEFYVGFFGEANMVVSDGGEVTNTTGYIGRYAVGSGNATIKDPNSLWENSAILFIGHDGDANMLVSNGGQVTNTHSYMGYNSTGVGVATITGPNSLWENSGTLFVGYSGDANMIVSDGGHVTSSASYVGFHADSNGYATITGPDSLWQTSANLYIGGSDTGPGGTGLLNVNDNGTVEANVIYNWNTGIIRGDGYLSGDVRNFGTLSPGNSIGTLNIDGDLTMDPNGTLEVEIDNSGNSDLLSVTGDVEIQGGTVKAISTDTIIGSRQYTIVEANSVSGTFDTLDSALLDIIGLFPHATLGYGSDFVLLQIMAMRFDDPNIPMTDNQRALGRVLQKIADGGGNGITTALQGLQTAGQVRGAYNQLSGQTRPQLAPITTADTSRFMGTVSERLHHISRSNPFGFNSGPMYAMAGPSTIGNMYASDAGTSSRNFALGNGTNNFSNQLWGFWGRGYGLFGDRDSESGVPGYQYTVYGTSFGLDYQFADKSIFGVTAGYSKSDVDYALSGSSGKISGSHFGIYGSTNSNDWHFDSILMYSYFQYSTDRLISLMGQNVEGDFDGKGVSGYLEARYDLQNLDSWLLQPLASFQFSYLDIEDYKETGGTSSLVFDNQSYQSYQGSLGMKVTKELFDEDEGPNAQVQLRGRWIHEFGDENSSVDARFVTNPGIAFKVADADISRDSAVLGAGLYTQYDNQTRLAFDYDVSLNSDETIHLISAALQHRW